LSAQLAPDFTITDSDGQEHTLYADYLNQGKTVLIEVFFTTCPPCNAFAPHMEPMYMEWGSGQYDVEFFDLSNKSFDTDALVNAYTANHGHTYPAAGVDGGSLQAVAPYQSGTFGPFFGTPTFIVIAPDGTVQFDIKGSNSTQTVAMIHAAIAATGAEMPECTNSYAIAESLCPGESVTIHGEVFDEPGAYQQLVESTDGGCDSLFWITITGLDLVESMLNVAVCTGESVIIHGVAYSDAGSYEVVVPSTTSGCDTLLTINVSILPFNQRTVNASFCPGESVVVYGMTYAQAGTYMTQVPSVTQSCDTIVTIHITALPYKNKAVQAEFTSGDSVLVYGTWYASEGVYTDTISSVTTACDTIVTITISEIPTGPEDILVGGEVKMFDDRPIANAVVIARNSDEVEVRRDSTDALGKYQFAFNETYFNANELTISVQKLAGPFNGVSVLDLAALQKHLLGLTAISHTEQLFAADVNRSGGISVLDVLFLRTVSLQNVYSGAQSGLFRGVKLGDLNNSANPQN
jgi:thiol-disulfide isomerase/thioredoxin